MTKFSWFKFPADLARWPKSMKLCATLSNQRAYWYVVELWCRCCEQYPDGRIPAADARPLEIALGWPGDAGVLMKALMDAGFLRPRGRNRRWLFADDWREREAVHAAKMERDRARMRVKRAQQREAHIASMAELEKTLEHARKARTPRHRDRSVARPSRDLLLLLLLLPVPLRLPLALDPTQRAKTGTGTPRARGRSRIRPSVGTRGTRTAGAWTAWHPSRGKAQRRSRLDPTLPPRARCVP